jgi:hypothetical protein
VVRFVRSALAAVCMFVTFASLASAYQVTGTNLLTWCDAGAGRCRGFVQGVRGMNYVFHLFDTQPSFCVPPDVNSEQNARVLVRYLKAHPETLHLNGAFLTAVALQHAYPCPRQ